MTNELSQMSQENILTLLAFDEKACPVLCSLDIKLFGSDVYRNVASVCIEYYKTFKLPAGSHLPDLLEEYINQKDKSKADIYKSVLINLNETKDTINAEYVLGTVEKFVRQQNLKISICEAFDLLQEQNIDGAEKILISCNKSGSFNKFSPGLLFNKDNSIKCINRLDEVADIIYTGIPELDSNRICPARKEQFTLFSLPNVGKSYWCIHIGKMASLQRKKVLHITLEMDEDKVCRRYLQAFFSIGKRKAFVNKHLLFNNTEDGKLFNFETVKPSDIVSFDEEDFTTKLNNYFGNLRAVNLIIKQFPTGKLTIDNLEAYLDLLEINSGFIPDVLIVDYPDLMKLDSKNLRVEVGRVFIDLRGVAVERNLANVNVTQCNRSGEGVKLLTRKHLTEDYSKIMTADNAISLNQTPEEYKLGLARLYVDKGRDEKKGDIIIISQNLSIGQFCMASAKMSNSYDTLLTSMQGVSE